MDEIDGSGRLSADTVALIGGIGALFNGLGRVAWGVMCDRLGYSKTLLTMLSTQAVAMCLYYPSKGHIVLYGIVTMVLFFTFGGNFRCESP